MAWPVTVDGVGGLKDFLNADSTPALSNSGFGDMFGARNLEAWAKILNKAGPCQVKAFEEALRNPPSEDAADKSPEVKLRFVHVKKKGQKKGKGKLMGELLRERRLGWGRSHKNTGTFQNYFRHLGAKVDSLLSHINISY